MSAAISILCPSFNHEKWVGAFLDSVLAQSFSDFELIVVDDHSTDKNTSIIKTYQDPRIKLIEHPYNMGINAAIQTAFEHSTADIVCLIASDDLLLPHYLETVLAAFAKQPEAGVFYTPLQRMSTEGVPLEDIVPVPLGKSRFQILHQSFTGGNLLTSPGMAMRRKAFESILPLPLYFLLTHDWDIHNKLLLKYDIILHEEPLVLYRYSEGSASAISDLMWRKLAWETEVAMDAFLAIPSLETIRLIFPEEDTSCLTQERIPLFMGVQALKSTDHAKQVWGYRTLMRHCLSREDADFLRDHYGLNFGAFISIPKGVESPVEKKCKKLEAKYLKSKRKFRALLTLALVVILILLVYTCC